MIFLYPASLRSGFIAYIQWIRGGGGGGQRPNVLNAQSTYWRKGGKDTASCQSEGGWGRERATKNKNDGLCLLGSHIYGSYRKICGLDMGVMSKGIMGSLFGCDFSKFRVVTKKEAGRNMVDSWSGSSAMIPWDRRVLKTPQLHIEAEVERMSWGLVWPLRVSTASFFP